MFSLSRNILKFYSLLIIAQWHVMLRILVCLVGWSIARSLANDYLATATQKGLDYVRDIGIPFLEKEISSLPIPDVKGAARTPVGKILYGLDEIHVKEISITHSNLAINEKTGLTVTCNNGEIAIDSKWMYKEDNWPHIKDRGSVTMHLTHVDVDITINIDAKNEDKPLVETRNCHLKIGGVNLKFSGGASWLYNLFANTIARELKSSISKEVCSAVSKLINEQGDKMLRDVPDIVNTIKIHLLEKDPSQSK